MTTGSGIDRHPFDLLEAYALDALEPDEEAAVADHVEYCEICSMLVGESLRVAAAIADSVPQVRAPEDLRRRLMTSIALSATPPLESSVSQRVSVSHSRPPRSWSRVSSAFSAKWTRILAPGVAVLAVVAILVMTALNLEMSNRVGDVQSENTQLRRQLDQSMATTAALAHTSNAVSQMQGNLQRWQETSYALAQPGNQTLVLSSAAPGIESRGVLVLSEDGREAVLMASNLAEPRPDSAYHVWLTKGGQWYWAGDLEVDDRGWGTMPMSSQESLLHYDSVQISHGTRLSAAPASPVGIPGARERTPQR